MNKSEKGGYYDKFMSHELNLFIYFKDIDYFDSVIRPFISCKIAKDIIDKYLLGISLDEYISQWWKLNYLEKILLLDWGMQQDETDLIYEVKLLAQDLENQVSAIEIDEENVYKLMSKIFQFAQMRPSNENVYGKAFASESYSNIAFDAEYSDDSGIMRDTMHMESSEDLSAEFIIFDSAKSYGQKSSIKPKKTLERTKEYAETYYFSQIDGSPYINPSLFWSELAKSIMNGKRQILTKDLILATTSISELIFALSVADLPFNCSSFKLINSDLTATLSAESNLIAFYKELAVTPSEIDSEILISQRFINPENSRSQIKQFTSKTLYESRVVISNTSDMDKFIYVLLQVPDGSIPLDSSFYTQTVSKRIAAYSTELFSFKFYFPYPGNFTFYPVVVTRNNKVIANTKRATVEIFETIASSSSETFYDLALRGEDNVILNYMRNKNLYSPDFNVYLLYNKLKDRNFYASSIGIFKERKYYDETAWLHSTIHDDYNTFYELLNRNDWLINVLGNNFNSNVIYTKIDDIKHYEYSPLINARAHSLGVKKPITNLRLKETYHNFLMSAAEKNQMDNLDYMRLCQYYILQDRYAEAIEIYNKIKESGMNVSEKSPGNEPLQIQYDYLASFIDFNVAEAVSSLYKGYPIETWKKLFEEIYSLVSGSKIIDDYQDISNEPALSFVIDGESLKLLYQNVDQCKIKIYYIDLEVLFSKNPFFIQDPADFAFLMPNIQLDSELKGESATIELPKEAKRRAVAVEIDYGSYTTIKTGFNSELKTIIIERYGYIKVTDKDNYPRSTAYIKVFSKTTTGEVEFYKDGYTDIRGIFDFVSLNYDKLSDVACFAILVVDEELGSIVLETNPPKVFTKDL